MPDDPRSPTPSYLRPPWTTGMFLSAEEDDLIRRAAARLGISVQHWARQVLLERAGEVLGED